MRILFFPPTKEIDLSGDQADLTTLAALVASGSGTLSSDPGTDDPSGQIALTHVRVQATDTMVLIKRRSDDHGSSGSPAHPR